MSKLITEQENPNTKNIDQVSILEAICLINNEDKKVAEAVGKCLPQIAETIKKVFERLKTGGRLFYIGTGTSGRLGVLDATEIPPTFGVSADLIQGVIAGGFEALYQATEASEDNFEAGKIDLQNRGLTQNDAVIGIAASGGTPYTIGAVEFAKNLGCFTACITCNPDSPITKVAEISIVAVVGAEAISGSTRMKAGTAQKMILNMISTVSMIKLGFVRGNKMTNLKPKNKKLIERSLQILIDETDLDKISAEKLLETAKNDLRIALIMAETYADFKTAFDALSKSDFIIDRAVNKIKATK
ncbi:MAG: N-acetylmuramic acid 6-phosphate etherase [Acidobacteriota bacterium]|jgi:N-acetylmuramic acid 6-phosphate etherase|nr:N-acetylmuramic acid 6-phosphate etherase [Acidobacteriota bacterium]